MWKWRREEESLYCKVVAEKDGPFVYLRHTPGDLRMLSGPRNWMIKLISIIKGLHLCELCGMTCIKQKGRRDLKLSKSGRCVVINAGFVYGNRGRKGIGMMTMQF